jgi:iron complex transport system ATP-binding protein
MIDDAILHTENLSVGYRHKGKLRVVQKALDVSVFSGNFTVLVGANGCGKSTLLKTLAGLHPPLHGCVRMGNDDLYRIPIREKAKRIAIVLTDPVRVSGLSVWDLVAMGRSPYTAWMGNLSRHDREKIAESLALIALDGYENRQVSELSDGEKQRVMIAKALVQDTPVIFLDEPTAHLDVNNRIEILSRLKEICEKTGKSMLLSTHELDLALQLSNRMWLMHASGIHDMTPDEVIFNGILHEIFPKFSYSKPIN